MPHSFFKKIFFVLIVSLPLVSGAQTVKVLTSGNKISLRGLSVVNDKVIWVSGSAGTVGISIDSGTTFTWLKVKGYEKTDLRDIEAFDARTAVIMGIDSPAVILRTTDGGQNWDLVYKNDTKGMFLDAMEFWNEQSGIVIGDPINNKIFIARTFDGGKKWQPLPDAYFPVAETGEACFASSGTNIRALNKKEAVFITGGMHSRMFIRDKKIELPVIQGKETTGANSVAVKNSKTLIVVGGDFDTKDAAVKNCFITTDKGETFTAPAVPPHGYRSCIEYLNKTKWITCGLTGIDISTDDGMNWRLISSESFHVCRKAKKGKAVFFAGSNGKIGKLIME